MAIPDQPNFSLSDVLTVLDIGSMKIEDQALQDRVDTGKSGFTYQGLYVKAGGTELFLGGFDSTIAYYSMSTPWDLNTLTLVRDSTLPLSCKGLSFSDDGTYGYINDPNVNVLNAYALSTPWDFDTATLHSSIGIALGSAYFIFKEDGTQMWFTNFGASSVIEYNLSTPWDLNTAVIGINLTTADALSGVIWVNNGTQMWGRDNDHFIVYNVGTPYHIGTVSDTEVGDTLVDFGNYAMQTIQSTFSVFSLDADNNDIFVNSMGYGVAGGTSLSGAFAAADDNSFDPLYEGNKDRLSNFRNYIPLKPLTALNPWQSDVAISKLFIPNTNRWTNITVSPDGLRLILLEARGFIQEFTMSTAWDFNTLVFATTTAEDSGDDDWQGHSWSSDGLHSFKIYNNNDGNYQVMHNEYPNAWTATGGNRTEQRALDRGNDVLLSKDGLKFWILTILNEIKEYTMSSPYNLASGVLTLTYTFDRGGNGKSLWMNDDETAMFVTRLWENITIEIALPTPGTLSGASPTATTWSPSSGAMEASFPIPGTSLVVAVSAVSPDVNTYDFSDAPLPPVFPVPCRDVDQLVVLGRYNFEGTSEDVHGANMSPDGTLVINIRDGGGIRVCHLAIPFDVTSIDYNYYYGDFETSTTVWNIWVSSDGSKVMTFNRDNDDDTTARMHSMPYAWWLRNPIGIPAAKWINVNVTGGCCMDFNNAIGAEPGTVLWAVDYTRHIIVQIPCLAGNPWDFSPAFEEATIPFGTTDLVYDIAWSEDGMELFGLMDTPRKIARYAAVTPYSLVGMTLVEEGFSVIQEFSRGMNIMWGQNKFILTNRDNDADWWGYGAQCNTI